MSILSINLFSFFLKPNSWRKNKIGILTVHAGALILLIGSAITNVFSVEGNMVIIENEKSDYMHSFYYKEFTVLNLDEYKDSIEVINFNEQLLKEEQFLSYHKLPFKIEITFLNADAYSTPTTSVEGYTDKFPECNILTNDSATANDSML